MALENKGLRFVAALEAFKGMIAVGLAMGIYVLEGKNLHSWAQSILQTLHVNLETQLAKLLLHFVDSVTESTMLIIMIGLCIYSMIRFVESYGLWHSLVWTEWFALVSGAVYIPFEIYEMIIHPNWFGFTIFIINVLVVWLMARVLFSKKPTQITTKALT
jgi:uncharacterized membrane protein (DUF2068 family)